MSRNRNYPELRVPAQFNMPWLTENYIMEHGFSITSEFLFGDHSRTSSHPEWGEVPLRDRTEFHTGDIIIFDEYDERRDKDGILHSDRFYILEEGELEDFLDQPSPNIQFRGRTKQEFIKYMASRTDLLPVGVVVHPPSYYAKINQN